MSTAQAFVSRAFAATHGDRTIGLRDLVVLSLAVAATCASFVFVTLCNSDQHYPIAAVQHDAAVPTQAPSAVPSPQPTANGRTNIDFTLRRSNVFQSVGPIRLRIWRIDARHESVRASILVSHRRIDKRMSINEHVKIPASPSQTLDLVINRVSRNQVSGYISEPDNTNSSLSVPETR
jgi:hypothetical protein